MSISLCPNKTPIIKLLLACLAVQMTTGQQIDPCLPSSKCGDINCSENGHCFYDIITYYKEYEKSRNSNTTIDRPFLNCVCDKGWTDKLDADGKIAADQVRCCYRMKSQFNAFLLEFVVGFGAGHFYIGNITLAVLKCVSFIMFCCTCLTIGLCFCYKTNRHNEEPTSKHKLLNVIFLFCIYTYMIWQIIDSVLFGINFYTDYENVELEVW